MVDYIDILPPSDEWSEVGGVKMFMKANENKYPLHIYFKFPESFSKAQEKEFTENLISILDDMYKSIGGDELVASPIKKNQAVEVKISPN